MLEVLPPHEEYAMLSVKVGMYLGRFASNQISN